MAKGQGSWGSWLLALTSALGVGLGCGGGSESTPGGAARGGSAGMVTSGGSGGDPGRSGSGGRVIGAGGSGPGGIDNAAAADACRDYFSAVCARIRECGAPLFRPCESPIDACPDILFADGSAWSVEQVVACTAAWKTQACDALAVDSGPACSQVAGLRAKGAECVFDAQCQSGRCTGGIVPAFARSCGTCVDVAPAHGACSSQQVCPSTQECIAGTCMDREIPPLNPCANVQCPADRTCSQGACVPLPGVGSACTRDTKCAAGLACQTEIVQGDANQPTMGTCQALPAIGQPCLPTFGQVGLCVDGGTCNSRPTGMCVPLVEVGQTCGYTACVKGAFCQIWGYDNLPPDICYLRGKVGAECDFSSPDHGAASCADGLDCICAQPPCDLGTCQATRAAGESCNDTTQICGANLRCEAGVCLGSGSASEVLPAGSPCTRDSAFGRQTSPCLSNLECLCANADCTQGLCAEPRNLGESCDAATRICRQGLTCNAGLCADAPPRDLERLSCLVK
jgi:hypothetical protein